MATRIAVVSSPNRFRGQTARTERRWNTLGLVPSPRRGLAAPGAPFYSKFSDVVTLDEIEGAIRNLSPEELASFREWFAEFDAAMWDRELEEDVASGKLDDLAEEALRDLRDGRCTER